MNYEEASFSDESVKHDDDDDESVIEVDDLSKFFSGLHRCSCLGCFLICAEVIWFTYHPLSRYSGMDPMDAEHLIERALADEECDIVFFAQMHHADPTINDLDPNYPRNGKTDGYCQIFDQKRRLQEAKLGEIKFRNLECHLREMHMEGDFRRNTKEFRELRARRHEATKKYAAGLNVDDLMEFTKPLRDLVRDLGREFNYKEFLMAVLPYWKARAREARAHAETSRHDEITHPYMIELAKQLNGTE